MVRTLHAAAGSAALLASALALALALTAPAAKAATLVGDGFESGSLSGWNVVKTGSAATAGVQSQIARSGSYAARLSATTSSSSYARKAFSTAQTDLTVAADLRIASGGSSGNVPLIRMFDAGGTRLLSLYRQNEDYDRLYVQHSGRYNSTSGALALNAWGRLEVTVKTAGSASAVVVKLDGTTIHQTTAASLGTAGVQTMQLGNDTYGQPFDVVADNVLATNPQTSADSPPPAPPPPPPPSSGCVSSAPVPTNSDPGTVVVADNFENGLGLWSVAQYGDARVTTQSETVKSGGCAARISVTRNSGSLGNLTRTLPSGTREIWATGWFNFEMEGVSTSWNLATFRMFTDGKRVLDVSRQNGSASLFVRWPNGSGGWTIKSTGMYPSQKRWYHFKIHAIANYSQSTVEVWLDGGRIFATTSATLGTSRLSTQMVGADHATQEGVVAVDDVVVKARS